MTGIWAIFAAGLLCIVGQDDPSEEIQKLIRDLSSDDPDVVADARRLLTDYEREALEPLKAALKETEGQAAKEIEFTLQMLDVRLRLTPEVSSAYFWIEEKIARDPDEEVPKLLKRMLSDRADLDLETPDFRPVVAMALEVDPEGRGARTDVLNAVNELKLNEFGPAIVHYLKDERESVSQFTAYVLVQVGTRETAGAVIEFLEDEGLPTNAQVLGVRVLAHLRVKEAAPLFEKFMDDAHPALRARAIAGLGAIRALEIAEKVVDKLEDKDPQVREAAAAVLVEFRAVDQVPDIAKLLSSEHALPVRTIALKTLAYLADRRAAGPISALLVEKDRDLKLGAIIALGKIGDPETAGALLKVMVDEPEFRDPAAASLARIKGNEIVPKLVKLVRHEDPNMRAAVNHILTTRSIDPLLDMLKGEDDAIAAEAATLLGLGLFDEPEKRLLFLLGRIPEERRPLVLLALSELGVESVKPKACTAALANTPLRHDLLFALNGLVFPRTYRRITRRGIRTLDLRATPRLWPSSWPRSSRSTSSSATVARRRPWSFPSSSRGFSRAGKPLPGSHA
jgi:HEAT repeat protein